VDRPKPSGLSREHASQFQDASIVRAYGHRVPYPKQTFDVLRELAGAPAPTVLDLGCGTGDVTVGVADFADRVDAIDVSPEMIGAAEERTLTRSNVRCILGLVESAPVSRPYDLVTAGQSLPWMDWPVVFTKLKAVLRPGRFLAIVERDYAANAWWDDAFQAIINRHSTNREYEKFDLVSELETRSFFKLSGRRTVGPDPFRQSVRDLVEAFHSRNGFSRDRMTASAAARFDEEATQHLSTFAENGMMNLGAVGTVTWGELI
jgi:ubiquinone/menaquinone biosynthesis C-methylase UbiE